MIAPPTQKEMHKDLTAFLQVLLPEISVSLDTDEGVRIQQLSEAMGGIHYELAAALRDVFPDLASDEAILKHAETRLGQNGRRGATTSRGTDALRAHGEEGSPIDAGEILVHTDGTRYQTTENGVIDAGGIVDLSIESISKGEQTNKQAGDTLTFESPPSGIEPDAELVDSLTGGQDQETIAELLVRLIESYVNPPAGGRSSDYHQWAMSIVGVSSAYVYCPSPIAPTSRRGLGTTDVAILATGSGQDRIPGAELVQEVSDKIDDARPNNAHEFSVLTPDPYVFDFDIQILPKTGYEWDWTPIARTVQSWEGGTKTLTWNTTLPSGVISGKRIMCNGELMVIASTGSNTTVLEETFENAPTPGMGIYPGGPLSEPCQKALKAYLDTLGPARGDAADPEMEWEDTYRTAQAYNALVDVPGVRDAHIFSPVATSITPTDHAPSGTVDYITYGKITVRSLGA